MANACDDYKQPSIDYLFNAADEISEAPNRALAVEALKRFEDMIVRREAYRIAALIVEARSE